MSPSKAVGKTRLDVFVAADQDVSRMQAGKLVRAGCVKVNGRVMFKPAHVLTIDDEIDVSNDGTAQTETHIDPVDLNLKILYEDDSCLVIDKPEGVAVHPAIGIPKTQPTILHGVAFLFQKRKIPFIASHILAHRLDRETTGCLLIAKTMVAHADLQKQFHDRTVSKTYLAIVHGVPHPSQATIDARLIARPMSRCLPATSIRAAPINSAYI